MPRFVMQHHSRKQEASLVFRRFERNASKAAAALLGVPKSLVGRRYYDHLAQGGPNLYADIVTHGFQIFEY